MAGYTRNDTTNNIATGNIINASDLDGEFDAVQGAFSATTGHVHDGTTGNGAPITKVGPTQDVNISGTAVTPKTDNVVDLGSSTLEFKDLWIDGTANIDALIADTATISAGTITGITDLAVADGGTGASTAAGARTNLGASTVGSNLFTLTNPSAITFPRINADNTVSTLNATDFRTATGSGTVTSVSGTGTVNGISLSGSITSSGSLTLGGTLSGVSLSTQVTGTLPVANGGTGSTTESGARTSLGATTVGGNLFTLTNPSAITFPRINADNTVSTLNATDFRTAIGAGTGNGTVTSITAGTGLNGGTITGSGTISLTNTGVAASSYTNANITVDAQGRITSASSGTSGGVTSVSGTGSVNGITLSGTVTSSGNLTLGGSLSGVSLTSQVSGTLPVANGGTGVTSSTGSSSVVLSTTPTITGLRETRVAMGASNVDLSSGNYFTRTISGATSLTVSNVPGSGTSISFILDLTNGGSGTITWFTGTKWAGGAAPALTASGRDVLGFFTHDGGTTWNGFLLAKDIR